MNPNADEILGQKVYKSLADLPVVPDIVDVFRKGSDIPSVIDDVVAIGAKTVWVQLGIWNQDAAIYGESKGLTVVMDRCIKVEHARFHGGLHLLGFDTGVISSHKQARRRAPRSRGDCRERDPARGAAGCGRFGWRLESANSG